MPTLTPVWSTAAIQGRHRRGQESEDEQVPPGLRKERQPGEGGVSEHGEAQRARPAQSVTNASEETAAQCPAQHEATLDDRAVAAYARIGGARGPEQLRDERRSYQGVKVHVQPVEGPAEPRGGPGAPLAARDLAEMRGLANCAWAGLHRFACLYTTHALSLNWESRKQKAEI